MKVTGQNNVQKILSSLINRIGKPQEASKAAIIAGAKPEYGMGVSVENPQIAALEQHFSSVPDFEYNVRQENLVINGPLMGGAEEEMLEV